MKHPYGRAGGKKQNELTAGVQLISDENEEERKRSEEMVTKLKELKTDNQNLKQHMEYFQKYVHRISALIFSG